MTTSLIHCILHKLGKRWHIKKSRIKGKEKKEAINKQTQKQKHTESCIKKTSKKYDKKLRGGKKEKKRRKKL
jgi:hypothetical protein